MGEMQGEIVFRKFFMIMPPLRGFESLFGVFATIISPLWG